MKRQCEVAVFDRRALYVGTWSLFINLMDKTHLRALLLGRGRAGLPQAHFLDLLVYQGNAGGRLVKSQWMDRHRPWKGSGKAAERQRKGWGKAGER